MKLIANGVNNQYFESVLPQKGIEVDGVFAAIAYGKDDTKFIQNCLDNHFRLDLWMRYDHTVPVAPMLLIKLLKNANNNIFCKLIPDMLHAKIVWWKGYGAYIGSANLTARAWYDNIETGVFFTDEELLDSEMLPQLEEFFDKIINLEETFPLSREIIDEQVALDKLRKATLGENQDSVLKNARSIPLWEGIKNVDKKRSVDKRKENFKKEWEGAISHIRNIAEQIADYRPGWIEPNIPIYWQVDQFLHAYYYNIVRQKDNTYPYEQEQQMNKANPQKALISNLQWWKNLPSPPSDEDHTFYESAPAIRRALSKDRILNLNVDELCTVVEATHATMNHVIKLSPSKLGRPDATYLSKSERAPLFTSMLFSQRNKKKQNILELLNYVLYGGKPESIWERIYQAGKTDEYQIKNYGVNSIAEVAGWAQPETTPPRNTRTNKALRALGYSVNVSM